MASLGRSMAMPTAPVRAGRDGREHRVKRAKVNSRQPARQDAGPNVRRPCSTTRHAAKFPGEVPGGSPAICRSPPAKCRAAGQDRGGLRLVLNRGLFLRPTIPYQTHVVAAWLTEQARHLACQFHLRLPPKACPTLISASAPNLWDRAPPEDCPNAMLAAPAVALPKSTKSPTNHRLLGAPSLVSRNEEDVHGSASTPS